MSNIQMWERQSKSPLMPHCLEIRPVLKKPSHMHRKQALLLWNSIFRRGSTKVGSNLPNATHTLELGLYRGLPDFQAGVCISPPCQPQTLLLGPLNMVSSGSERK